MNDAEDNQPGIGTTSSGAHNSAEHSAEDSLGGSTISGSGARNPADLNTDHVLYRGGLLDFPWQEYVRNGFRRPQVAAKAEFGGGGSNGSATGPTPPAPKPNFGTVTVKEPAKQPLGNVTVKEPPKQPLGSVTVKMPKAPSGFGKVIQKALPKGLKFGFAPKEEPAPPPLAPVGPPKMEAPDVSHVAGIEVPLELKPHFTSGAIIPHDHPLREKAAQFVTDVWRKSVPEGKRMSSKLLGIAEDQAEHPNVKPGFATIKSEPIVKSKNVREQRKKVFGGAKTGPKSKSRAKQMKTLKDYAEKRFNTPVRRAKGKESSSGKTIDKPDMTTGFIEHIGNPDSLAHELAHIDLAPEKVALKQFQEDMDKEWGAANVKHGYKQQSRTASEYEATARENQIRRKLGMPAHAKTRDVKKPEQAMAADRPFLKIARKVLGQKKHLTGGSEVISPENKRLLEARDSSKSTYHPDKGWVTRPSIHTAMNLPGAGAKEEGARAGRYYFRAKLKKSKPMAKHEHDPHHLLSSGRYALMTPHKSDASPKENNASHESFMKDLAQMGHTPIPAKGMFQGASEPSYMIPDMKREDAVNLGKKYGQMSVIHSNGGEHEEISTHPSYKAMGSGHGYAAVINPNHNHTEIQLPDGRPFRFALNFDGQPMHKAEDKYLEHFSTTPGLKAISPHHMGTGAPSQENKHGIPEVARSYYYEHGTKPEDLVVNGAKAKYHVKLPADHKLYDLATDKDGHIKAAVQDNQGAWNTDKILGRIRDAGYHGYKNSKSTLPNVVAMFHSMPVHHEEPV